MIKNVFNCSEHIGALGSGRQVVNYPVCCCSAGFKHGSARRNGGLGNGAATHSYLTEAKQKEI